jgi:uncharacterized OB-fold protein
MLNEGWKCPECKQVFAPFVMKCDTCGDKIKITINPVTDNRKYCVHTWSVPRTNGTFCTMCGMQKPEAPPTGTTCGGTLND